jgi:hypothetical protein
MNCSIYIQREPADLQSDISHIKLVFFVTDATAK